MTQGQRPKRHHYIPQMILRNFANDDGRLFFWRRNLTPGDVHSARPENLFVEKDLYTQIESDGSKDTTLEASYAKLEGVGADFIRQLLSTVRSGKVPKPDDGAWEFWATFMYFQMKRAPAYLRTLAERIGHREAFESSIREARESGRYGDEDFAFADDPVELDRIVKNSMVVAHGLPPSEEVREAFGQVGLSVFVAPPGKSLVIGEVPNALARIGNAAPEAPGGKVTFMPIASDVAVGFLAKPRAVEVVALTRDQVRSMNEAMASQSAIFAGRSKALVQSLSLAVPYAGIPVVRELLAKLEGSKLRRGLFE